jgi:NADPH:quinone reductase-like Zn-dependent oxidoreductase
MSSKPSNQAAWLVADKVSPLEVKEAPYPVPEPNEIVIQTRAVALNPVDYGVQSRGIALFPFLTYPRIFGMDLAGIVKEVGTEVTRFKPGDRVLAVSDVLKKNAAGAFQLYVVAQENMASPFPANASFEQACVLPACLGVAAVGMFHKDYLALELPTLNPTPKGKTLLVWGGSTSVGCNGIQLGVAAGYEVVTTCSPHNFEFVKKLGASYAFDYKSPTVVADILDVFKDKVSAGAVAIGNMATPGNGTLTAQMCLEIVSKTQGAKFVAMAMPYKGDFPEGVDAKFIHGNSLKDNELGADIFEKFLPKALEEGRYLYAPEPLVAGKGLESIQEAIEVLKRGVSAKKVVVSL